MADEEAEALVIDNGSGSIKAGIAGEDAPKVRVRSRWIRVRDFGTTARHQNATIDSS